MLRKCYNRNKSVTIRNNSVTTPKSGKTTTVDHSCTALPGAGAARRAANELQATK